MLRSLPDHGSDLLARLRIEKGSGFIQHFHRSIPQPGTQQAESMDFTTGKRCLGKRQRGIQTVRSAQQMTEAQAVQPCLDDCVGLVIAKQQVVAQAGFKQHGMLRRAGHQAAQLLGPGQT